MVKKGIAQFKKENAEIAARNNNISHSDNSRGNININPPTQSIKSSLVGAYNSDHPGDVGSDYQKLHDSSNLDHAINTEQLALKSGATLSAIESLTATEQCGPSSLVASESAVVLPMLWMGAVWVIVSLFALLRSGKLIAITSCSAAYWAFEFAVFPCLFVITFVIARKNMSSFNRKVQLRWVPAEGDIEWTVLKSFVYPSIALSAGLLGGLLGIGGGMIVSPLLLELGVQPRVASATSAVAVLMTSSSSTFQKVLLNMIRGDYMAFFAAVGIVGTFIGQTVVNVAIRKYGRNSIVIGAVASVIAVAIVLMGVNSVLDMTWS